MPEQIQETFVLCVSVEQLNIRPAMRSVKGRCSDCDREVWMAPSSIELLQIGAAKKVICEKCFAALRDIDPIFAISEKAIQELAAHEMGVENN